ncbi:alkaline shock response membrane anchor protein AmaP [Candidatus Contubernalis alkaliaceticus]|uniref:alkaline shock response membrane anchor protein AmaP n=1 Tax=Candidatus Contubernalis alkaliaceticus TaxID=338645 RepID=UPI001F4C3DBA|nr:alkaline shock response membrane anchor protein AmaP [Candidatus Contubernalis alkalaceticus]UNC92362.1 alkaline shock response membrane anchor protein AmaP [Candidatus Contubernalis alkalaceticus]
MNFRERLVYLILSLILLLAALLFLGFAFSILPLEQVDAYISYLYGNLYGALIALLVLIISLWLFSKSFKAKENAKLITQSTPQGEYMVSFTALESMVLRSSKEIEGVKELEPQIIYSDGNLIIFIKTVFFSGYEIPAVSQQLQENVKNYIEEMAGISVFTVKIFIENVAEQGINRIPREKEV